MRRIRTLHAKWVGAVGSHRASMLAASVLLSLLVTASGFFRRRHGSADTSRSRWILGYPVSGHLERY